MLNRLNLPLKIPEPFVAFSNHSQETKKAEKADLPHVGTNVSLNSPTDGWMNVDGTLVVKSL